MSKSTLPDLFKADLMAIKFHPQDRPRKIGGRFSISLNQNHNQSSQKSDLNLKYKDLSSTTTFTRSVNRNYQFRSQSIHNLMPLTQQEQVQHQNFVRTKKSIAVQRQSLHNSRKHSGSLYTKDVSTLEDIYFKNLQNNKKLTMNQIIPGFPNETTRSMNNMKVHLEQADSMKNKVDSLIQTHQQCQNSLTKSINQTQIIKKKMIVFKEMYLDDLERFKESFLVCCKSITKKLSQFRRQTGEQTKINLADSQKLYFQYKDATSIMNLLQQRSNLLRNQCLDQEKLELTNSKTYSYVNNRIYTSLKQNDLQKLFKHTKRSGTSHQLRSRTVNTALGESRDERNHTGFNTRRTNLRNKENTYDIQNQQPVDDYPLINYQKRQFEDSLEPDQRLSKNPRKFILNGQQTQFLDF